MAGSPLTVSGPADSSPTGAPSASRDLEFQYNSRSELTQEKSTPNGNSAYSANYPTLNFNYDEAFNPLGIANVSIANADNQLYSFSYDNNGNQTSSSSVLCAPPGVYTLPTSPVLRFDPENRMTSFNGCTAMTFGYDGDGLRAWKSDASGTKTFFLYDGDEPLLELDASGNIKAANGYTVDGIRARYYPGNYSTTYYTFDTQGNLVQRLRSATTAGVFANDVLDTVVYSAYGVKEGDVDTATGGTVTADTDPVGFGGQHGYYTDPETNLVLMTHRYYDPQVGRFITRDPIGYKGGVNLYGFCGNNPVTGNDPSGYSGNRDRRAMDLQYEMFKESAWAPIKGYSSDAVTVHEWNNYLFRAEEDELLQSLGIAFVAIGVSGFDVAILASGGFFRTAGSAFEDGGANIAYHYTDDAIADIARKTGFVPNTNAAGKPRDLFVSPDLFHFDDDAERFLQIGKYNPMTPKGAPPALAPTYRIDVDLNYVRLNYGGNILDSPHYTEMTTSDRLPPPRL